MTQEESISYNNVAYFKKVKKALGGYYKIGYYDMDGKCLVSAIDKGLQATENVLKQKVELLNIWRNKQ